MESGASLQKIFTSRKQYDESQRLKEVWGFSRFRVTQLRSDVQYVHISDLKIWELSEKWTWMVLGYGIIKRKTQLKVN